MSDMSPQSRRPFLELDKESRASVATPIVLYNVRAYQYSRVYIDLLISRTF